MSDDSRISPYNIADCKNTTDDALQNYLNSLKYRQSHYYTDVKLVMGYTAVVIAAATFALDYKLGFDATKGYTAIAVAIYFLLNGAYTFWIWQVEKGLVFMGAWKGRKITIHSRTNKYDPTYHLTVTYNPSALATQPPVTIDVSAPFMQWFTADGFFVAQPFQQWLASSVPMVGDSDPKNFNQDIASGGLQTKKVRSEGLQSILNDIKAGSATTSTDSTPRKRN